MQNPAPLLAVLLALSLLVAGCSSDTQSTSKGAAAQTQTVKLSDDQVRDLVDEVLDMTERRHMRVGVNNAWQIVHGILAYGHGLHINVDGKLVPALDYLLKGGQLEGWAFLPGEKGLDSLLESGTKTGQGHEDQWLGVMSLIGLEADQTMVVREQTYTINDLMTEAEWDLHPGMEATWTLWALSAYRPLDYSWKSSDGTEWTIDRVLEMETEQDLRSSACGGTHRMTGLCVAVNRRLAEGGELTGPWQKTEQKIQECIAKAKEYQQPDGALSASYFNGSSSTPDLTTSISTTGHTLEFLAMAMTPEQLREEWMTRAVVYLSNILKQTRDLPIECGGLYHAARGLQIYRLRRFGERTFDLPGGETEQPPGDANGPDAKVAKVAK